MSKFTLGEITDESIADLKKRIGERKPIRGWNSVATKDAIFHFTEGLGDDNPLWRDDEYASKSKYGQIVAPPTFLYTFSSFGSAQAGMGLPGVHGLWAQDDWEFFKPVFVGDEVTATLTLVEVIEKSSRWGQIRQNEEFKYENKKTGEIIGKCNRLMFRAAGKVAKEKGKYQEITKYKYTESELNDIVDQYMREEPRGSTPRYWEDINIGEEVGPILKGPLTVIEMITWLMGWGSPLCKASRISHRFMAKHPGACVPDPETGVPDFPERAHWDEPYAKACGIGAGYDIGAQRISWFGHLMTDWIGDDGFLKKLKVQLRRPNYLGDLLWCKGKVINKEIKEGEYIVECELRGKNQRDEIVVLGWATAILPSKANGDS